MWVCGAVWQVFPGVCTGEYAGNYRRTGTRSGQQVAGGIAGHGDLADVVDPETQHRRQDHVRCRASPASICGGKHVIHQVAPPQGGDQTIPGDR